MKRKTVKKSNFIENVERTARENPLFFAFMVLFVVSILCFVLAKLEVFPPEIETIRVKWGEANTIDKGDNLVWLGMELASISRGIRKEFNLPRKVKGLFVVSEGTGVAKEDGVKTGDIICSVNRRTFKNKRSFIKIAKETKYYDGILLEIYRDKKFKHVSIPFHYEYGPIMGPNKGHWQLGSPIFGPIAPYRPAMR